MTNLYKYILFFLLLTPLITYSQTKTSVQSGGWNDPLTWDLGVPDSTDNAVISVGHTVDIGNVTTINNLTVSNGSTLSNTKDFTINGNFTLNGTCDGKKDILLNGVGTTIYGYGSKTDMGQVTITGNKTIAPTANITISNDFQINTNTIVTNNGKVTINGRIVGIDVTSTWVNSTNSTLNAGDQLLDIGTLVASATGNTVNYTRAGPQTIKTTSNSNYYNLIISGNNTKTLGSNTNIINELTISTLLSTNGNTLTLLSTASKTARISEINGGSLSGNFTMQRYIAGDDDWRLLASPVSSTLSDWNTEIVMSGFPGSNAPSFPFISVSTYDETIPGLYNNGYVTPSSITDVVNSGVGYFIWVGDALGVPITKTIDMTGALVTGQNMGTVNLTVSHTVSSGDLDDGWNLIGNPYPSDIEWDSVTLSGTLTPFGYIWNPNSDAYESFDQNSGRTVPSHQGVWVKVAEGGMGTHNETVTFNENDKAADGNNYLKTSNTIPHIKLNLSGGGYDRSTDIRFIQNATEDYNWEYDAFSIPSLKDDAPNFSTVSSDLIDLSINSLPELNQSFGIPIRVTWGTVGGTNTYTISIEDIQGIPQSSCLILEDQWSNTFTDLRVDTSYTFTMTQTNNLPPRFILHINPPLITTTMDITCNGMNDGMATSTLEGAWVDYNGDTISISKNVYNLSPGNYTIYVNDDICSRYETVSIIEPSDLTVVTTITNMGCNESNTGEIDLMVSNGTPPYTYQWSTGEITNEIVNLSDGIYYVTITENNNCINTLDITIEPSIIVMAGYTASSSMIDVGEEITFNNISIGGVTYSWDFGDGNTSTEENPTHTYNTPGNYQVTLTAYNDSCQTSSSNIISVNDIVSIIENENILVTLKPYSSAEVEIYNLVGQKIKHYNVTYQDEVIIPMSDNVGIYVVVVRTENFNYSKKIFISYEY